MGKIKLTEKQIEYIQYFLENGLGMIAEDWEGQNYDELREIAEKRWVELYNNRNYKGSDHLIEWLWLQYVEQEKDNRSFDGMLMKRVKEENEEDNICSKD